MEGINCKEGSVPEKIIFGIIGGGWRSEFFLRIARELPERFEVCGLVTRDAEKGARLETAWGIQTFRTIEQLLEAASPSFVVVSVSGDVAPAVTKELVCRGVAVLEETPAAPNLEQLIELNKLVQQGAKIQVAEQYHLQPMHAACIAIANSGRLGAISQVQVSFSHGYHGVSMIRKLLGVGFENAEINALRFVSPIVAGYSRKGLPEQETIVEVPQEFAFLNFGGKLAVYDFERDQHRSFIRSQRMLVRGLRGEIHNTEVKYLKDYLTPIEYQLIRKNTGENANMEGYHLKGILAGDEWVYKNPFIPGKLSDDEIAIATCLGKMDAYVKGGPPFYSLAEASQDQYLALMISKAIAGGEKVVTEKQPWASM